MKKKLVEVSVRKNFGVIMNSFSQFHSTFIRKHSRFFLRIGHKPQSVVYKVCTYMSSGNLSLFFNCAANHLTLCWQNGYFGPPVVPSFNFSRTWAKNGTRSHKKFPPCKALCTNLLPNPFFFSSMQILLATAFLS